MKDDKPKALQYTQCFSALLVVVAVAVAMTT
jgi:hypothetical protein